MSHNIFSLLKEEFCDTPNWGTWIMDRAGRCLTFLMLVFPLALVETAENPFPLCSTSTYAANSTYEDNFQRLRAYLVGNASLTGYYNATVGKGADQVHGLLQCRGDLDGEVCQVCATEAASQITKTCLNKRQGLVAYHLCLMYYYDATFSIPQFLMNFTLPSPGTVPDPQRFMPMLASFFRDLTDSAGTKPSGRLFWGNKFRYTDQVTVYGTVECAQYLSPEACKSCLDEGIAGMLKAYANRNGAAVYNRAKCYIRYDNFPFFTPLLQTIALSSASYVSSSCSGAASSNMTGTRYHRNLKVLLVSLIENGPLTVFFNQTVGRGPDQVYGEVLCRGDVPGDVCWNCTAQASAKILQLCPNSKKATIWLDYCHLRYSDVNLAGIVDVNDKACQPDNKNASSAPCFDQNLRTLISSLSSYVTQGSSGRMFATGISELDKSQRIYALVQCTKDISADQCGWCLQSATSDIAECSMGRQGARIFKGSCRLAFGLQPFFLGNPNLASSPLCNQGSPKRWWIFATISAIGGVLLAAACTLCLLGIRRRRSLEKLKHQEASSSDVGNTSENEVGDDLPRISLRTILNATDRFSEAKKVGEGGYGSVYKGELPNGEEVAVKRLSQGSGQGSREFKNEVKLIAKLQHVNLVRLVGCCLEKGEKLLLYEYMPNKSLDFFLKDLDARALLDWSKRSNIIIGIASGILYLHQHSRLNIIHRDLKASNVLLDEKLNPKISDFGMARIFSGNQGQATTSVIVGTYGYMAPEYAMDGVFSTKSDVYSFGVLLLEIISGHLSARFHLSHPANTLIAHAWSLWSEGNASGFIDPVLRSTNSRSEMQRCIHIGLLCIQEDAACRPTMSTVLLMLGNNSLALPSPIQPALFIGTAAKLSVTLFCY